MLTQSLQLVAIDRKANNETSYCGLLFLVGLSGCAHTNNPYDYAVLGTSYSQELYYDEQPPIYYSTQPVISKRSLNHVVDFQTEVVTVYAIFGSTSCQGSNASKSSTVFARGNWRNNATR